MKKSHSLLFSYGVAACLGMGANGLQAAEPLMLQKVMKDLGRNMQAVTDGISREDWTLIEKQALLIADHPQPPLSEKVRIMGFVGTSMTKYKAYDGDTHAAAQDLGRAAIGRDGMEGIAHGAALAAARLLSGAWRQGFSHEPSRSS